MSDFKTALIEVIETAAPELTDKIQCGAVDAETVAPFATYSTPEEVPVRTKDGIAGYDTLFEVEVYDNRVAGAERLKQKVRGAVEGLVVGGRVCRFRSASSDYYPDYDLHSYTLTFKVS
ncbi:MAG: hypothetical protein IJK20_00715 [Bacteroidales bacterium]|nr:hypothetical protein [Bacteroidales bacterium]